MDESLEQRVLAFLEAERRRLGTAQGNMLGMVLGEVLHYQHVVRRVLDRYETLNSEYLAIHDRLQASLSGSGEKSSPLTDEQQRLSDQSRQRGDELRQEIETYCLFSRILLDKMTQTLVACLGPGTGEQTSHRRFIATIDTYLGEKKLAPLSSELKTCMQQFETSIIDFRDHAVVHAKSPRGLRGLAWNRDRREAYLIYHRLYPRETDKQINGLSPSELMRDLEQYTDLWLSYLEQNSSSWSEHGE